jgi:hypothetical protein
MDRRLLDYIPELELPAIDAPRAATEAEDGDDELDDDVEMTLAAELLEVSSTAELASFLADMVARVGPAGAAGLCTPLGQAVVRILQRAVGQMLPIRAAGDAANLKLRAAKIFGIEIEGLSPEDKEFEVARAVVRFAAATVINALQPDSGLAAGAGARARAGAPLAKVQAALAQAARQHAPGLLAQAAPGLAQGQAQRPAQRAVQSPAQRSAHRPTQGRWQRQGNRIVVLDC